MGEKPLSMDEAPVQTALVGGGSPLGGVDTPPGMAAGGINTTRSNIKNSGGVVGPPPADAGGGGAIDVTDDVQPPPGMAAGGINTTRSNIKHAVSAAGVGTATDAGGADGITADGEPIPGIDTKGR